LKDCKESIEESIVVLPDSCNCLAGEISSEDLHSQKGIDEDEKGEKQENIDKL
jgi:hypothetical protein